MATHPNTQIILESMQPLEYAHGVPREKLDVCVAQIAEALSGDYMRHQDTLLLALKLTAEKERLLYWFGRILQDKEEGTSLSGAAKALIDLGYNEARLQQILDLGEPRESLSLIG